MEDICVSCAPYRVAVFELVTYSRIRVEGGRVPVPITAAHNEHTYSSDIYYNLLFGSSTSRTELPRSFCSTFPPKFFATSKCLMPFQQGPHSHSLSGPSPLPQARSLSDCIPEDEKSWRPVQQRKHTWPPPQAELNNEATGEGVLCQRTCCVF